MRKKLSLLLAGLMVSAVLAGCVSSASEAGDDGRAQSESKSTVSEEISAQVDADGVEIPEEPVGKSIKLTFGHGQAEGHPYQKAALYFKDYVEKASGGAISVSVYPNGTLGDEREEIEELQLGGIDITVAVASALSGFDSDMDVFNMPYLFDSREQAFKVLDGDVGQEIFGGLEQQGIKTFGTYDLGFRSMTNSIRPINTPADAKGLRMRTLESSVCVDALGALGIDAVSMSFSELFTSLQTGAIDGQENPLFTIYNSRFYEVQKYLSLTEHFYPVCPLMLSEITWNKLDPDQQKIVEEGLEKSVNYERKLAGNELDSMLQKIKEKGMEVNEVDKEPFKQAVQPVYEKYQNQFGELVDKINAAKEG